MYLIKTFVDFKIKKCDKYENEKIWGKCHECQRDCIPIRRKTEDFTNLEVSTRPPNFNKYTQQKSMQKEDTSLMTQWMNASSYKKQAQGKIPDDKSWSLSTGDFIKHSMSDNLILCCQ